jgi:REP element-mobilizing transposase RayT
MKKQVQLELELPTWGGRRDGAGRKRTSARSSVPHVVRPHVRSWNPVHVTIRVREDVPDLRQRPVWAGIVRTLREFRGRYALRVVHFSVLRNHLHFIVEAPDRNSLSRGMQALCTRLAKQLNAFLGRRGTLFAGRYHARELTSPRDVRNALRYVLLNARHHAQEAGIVLPSQWIDPRSTAAIFDGWLDAPPVPQREMDFGTMPAESWLLRVGWRTRGLLGLDEVPGGHAQLLRAA